MLMALRIGPLVSPTALDKKDRGVWRGLTQGVLVLRNPFLGYLV